MRIVDLSRELYHRTPSYPGQPPIIYGVWKTHEEAFADSGNVQGNSVMFFSMPDHGGTHIDAPRHFFADGYSVSDLPLDRIVMREAVVIDVSHKKPGEGVTGADLERTGVKPAPRISSIISSRDIRNRQPAAATTFSSSMVPPRSLAPKKSATWASFAPWVTQLACRFGTLCKTTRERASTFR